MVKDKSCVSTVDHELTDLSITLDTATEEASFVLPVHKEFPESVFASIMSLDHWMWEASCLLVPDDDLLWLETSKLLNTLVDVS